MTQLLDDESNGEKRKTKDVQGGSDYGELHGNARSMGTFTIAGNETRIIEVPINRADCQRRNPGRSAINGRDAVAGGILRQLITQTHNQVAHRLDDIKRSEDDIKRLKNEVQELNSQAKEWQQLLEALESEPIKSEN